MSFRFLSGVGVMLLSAAIVAPAHAQEGTFIPLPLAEVSAGYTFMRDFEEVSTDRSGTNFPAGWFTSGGVNVTPWMGLIGEVTGSYKNHFYDFAEAGNRVDNDARLYTFMGGPRFFYKRGRLAPYAQVLAGAAHMRMNTKVAAAALSQSATTTNTDFSIQPGGGLAIYLTESVGVRVAADYRSIIDFEGNNTYLDQFRIASGLTFHWGRR
jgi:hypothetical protein